MTYTDSDGNEIGIEEVVAALRKLSDDAGALYAAGIVRGWKNLTIGNWEAFRKGLRKAVALLEDIDGPKKRDRVDRLMVKAGTFGRGKDRVKRVEDSTKSEPEKCGVCGAEIVGNFPAVKEAWDSECEWYVCPECRPKHVH